MTYCIVNKVIQEDGSFNEQFMCIGIPDNDTAITILSSFVPYQRVWNLFRIHADPYQLQRYSA